ncbi:MAG TPA: hypothetical protein VFU17_01095 [Candidatus Limnocylindrales bacterium]|nr:hypothetical protein [Candidatus Limnocylindrales bacterium]
MTETSNFEDRFAAQLRAYAAPAARPPSREAVASAVEAARNVRVQRRLWWPAWGSNRTNTSAKLLAAAAAVLVVAVVGSQFLPRSGGVGVQPTTAPSPTGPGSSEAPASLTPSRSGDGSLPVGQHLIEPGRPHGEDRVTVTIPAPGWFAPDEGSLTKDLGGGNRVTVVVVPGDYYTVPRSICNWQTDEQKRFPPSVEAFVDFLAEQTYDTPDESLTREFSAPEDLTIDGYFGQRIMNAVQEYPDSDPSACDEQRFCTLQDRDGFGCVLSHPEPGTLDTIWVVHPGENRLYFLVVASTGRPDPELRAEMNAMVNSMTFYVD